LKKLGLWNQEMLDQIKYHDGSLQLITALPENVREKYREAFEIDPEWGIELTAARAKWIDQSQSHNIFVRGVSGTKLASIYMKAWLKGLKTTYYLRTLAASQIEKATLDANKFGFTQKREYIQISSNGENVQQVEVVPAATAALTADIKACLIDNPDCEACQ